MLGILADTRRSTKKAIALVYDTVAVGFSLFAAICLRLGTLSLDLRLADWIVLGAAPLIAVAVFARSGVYRTVVRYATYRAFLFIVLGLCASTTALVMASFFFNAFVPRSVPIIFFFIGLVFVSLPRLAIRNLVHIFKPANSIPVLIYGSGRNALALAASLRSDRSYYPIAFIDDDPSQKGNSYNGIPVLSQDSIAALIQEREIKRVFIATEDESKRERLRIVRSLERYPVRVQTIPAIRDLISGQASISEVHDVDISELLGRDPVAPDVGLMKEHISGKNVLVTGAGGSIGSEICKQIIEYRPKCLVLFEYCEYNLYQVYETLFELNINHGSEPVLLVPVLGDVRVETKIDAAVKEYGIDAIYHAAAYKHVPLVETNPFEGIYNNLFGTLTCAEAAVRNRVETFVLVSTDKAVRPTNIMGATKRLAEMCLQALARQDHQTIFCMVRFGNVLNSSGSVVPKFRQQINRGGPVTVTHPEITRYFMTTAEAAQLVIQAGALATGGEVFVLDMGEPIKILDLAREMILLSGMTIKDEHNPHGDIEIAFTGLRAGEKLYEELLIGENAAPTRHPRIRRAEEFALEWEDLSEILSELRECCDERDLVELQEKLMTCPIAYAPTNLPVRPKKESQVRQFRVVSIDSRESWDETSK